jgi:hypothetical protein
MKSRLRKVSRDEQIKKDDRRTKKRIFRDWTSTTLTSPLLTDEESVWVIDSHM